MALGHFVYPGSQGHFGLACHEDSAQKQKRYLVEIALTAPIRAAPARTEKRDEAHLTQEVTDTVVELADAEVEAESQEQQRLSYQEPPDTDQPPSPPGSSAGRCLYKTTGEIGFHQEFQPSSRETKKEARGKSNGQAEQHLCAFMVVVVGLEAGLYPGLCSAGCMRRSGAGQSTHKVDHNNSHTLLSCVERLPVKSPSRKTTQRRTVLHRQIIEKLHLQHR